MLQNLNFLKCDGVKAISSVHTSDPATGKYPFCSNRRSLYWEIISCDKCPHRVLNAIDLSMDSVRNSGRDRRHTPHPPADNILHCLWSRSQVCIKLRIGSQCYCHMCICLMDHILHPSQTITLLPSWGT